MSLAITVKMYHILIFVTIVTLNVVMLNVIALSVVEPTVEAAWAKFSTLSLSVCEKEALLRLKLMTQPEMIGIY